NSLERQSEIFKRQLEKELSLQGDLFFLNRSLIDCFTYSKSLLKENPKLFPNLDLSKTYTKVFVLDRLPFDNTHIRVENSEEEAEQMHKEIIKSYEEQNYGLINVPVMSVDERVEFMLDKIK
ncbi:MAG: AAA family ATPase, partial [Nanoarchaeota archaeon]|nr:AAA family ATPase [Nanoarchaeota archaeon]